MSVRTSKPAEPTKENSGKTKTVQEFRKHECGLMVTSIALASTTRTKRRSELAKGYPRFFPLGQTPRSMWKPFVCALRPVFVSHPAGTSYVTSQREGDICQIDVRKSGDRGIVLDIVQAILTGETRCQIVLASKASAILVHTWLHLTTSRGTKNSVQLILVDVPWLMGALGRSVRMAGTILPVSTDTDSPKLR